MHIARRMPFREPARKRKTSVAPKHQSFAAAEVVSHPLPGERRPATGMKAGHLLLQEAKGAFDAEVVVGKGVDALGETNQPAAVRISRGKLRRHAELAQRRKVEWRPARHASLQALDYLVAGNFNHG